MAPWLPIAIAALPLLVLRVVDSAKAWRWQIKARRLRNPRPPKGATTTLSGWVRPLRLVTSPITGLRGVVTYALVATRDRDLRDPARCAEVRAAADFLLMTGDGPVLIRTDDVWMGIVGDPVDQVSAAPGPALDALRAAGHGEAADRVAELPYLEVVLFPGSWVRVTGVLRDEPAPVELTTGSGYRDSPTIKTLCGGGGALAFSP